MGIPRLTARLHHKAEPFIWPVLEAATQDERQPLSATGSKIAIIDGPGLAFYIFHQVVGALAGTPNQLRLQVDYQRISDALIAWLDDLVSRGFVIHKLYFDAALPPQKYPVRVERARKSAQQAANIRLRYEEKARKAERNLAAPRLLSSGPWLERDVPRPPFLVSSMIAGLQASQYKDVVELVPGEADNFCATAAKDLSCQTQNVIFIFTNDSDLLVALSGDDTQIVMLETLRIGRADGATTVMHGKSIKPMALARSLALPNLQRVAFEMKLDSNLSLEDAASQVNRTATVDKAEYTAFLEEISSTVYDLSDMTAQQRKCLQSISPKLTELICRLSDQRSTALRTRPSFFLPQLLDDTTRASAWRASADIRRLAYSIQLQQHKETEVLEYDRKGDRSQPIAVTPFQDIEQAVRQHLSWFNEQVQQIDSQDNADLWRVLALIIISSHCKVEGRALPSRGDATAVLRGQQLWTWTQIHLSAQTDAALYSLRMLQHVLGFRLAGKGPDFSNDIKELADLLNTLPSLLSLFRPSAQQIERLIPDEYVLGLTVSRPPKRRKKTTPASRVETLPERNEAANLASNPYAMLAD